MGVCCGSCRVVCSEVFWLKCVSRCKTGVLLWETSLFRCRVSALLGVEVGVIPNIVSATDTLGFRGVSLECSSSELSFCASKVSVLSVKSCCSESYSSFSAFSRSSWSGFAEVGKDK